MWKPVSPQRSTRSENGEVDEEEEMDIALTAASPRQKPPVLMILDMNGVLLVPHDAAQLMPSHRAGLA